MNSAKVTVGIPTYNRPGFLREAIKSVLAQTYTNFRLVISDNASAEETRNVVASFNDPRVRADQNVGMTGNFNRVIELADTELLVILPDDDLLYPDYLSSVLEVIDQCRTVGVVHTAFDVIDDKADVRTHAVNPLKRKRRITFEPGQRYLERSMTAVWPVCFSSAIYRTRAIVEAGGIRDDEQPFADLPMWMRIAVTWDFASLARPLVGYRDHPETASMRIGSEAGRERDGRKRILLYAQTRFDRRIAFLDQAGLSRARTRRLRSLATVSFLVESSGLGTRWVDNSTTLIRVVREYPKILLHPLVWRLVAAQLGGRQVRRALQRLAS
jgi:glycosyltransferase involved in cell wall biosynthesis